MSKLCVFVLILTIACFGFVHMVNPEGNSCYSYAGGMVYPAEFRDPEKTGHQLQWTKAMSKLTPSSHQVL